VDLNDDQIGDPSFDAIIVGQGLAGTTLGWHLHDAGLRVLIIDADEPMTSSKIAAGLITPITGRRMALSWQDETLAPTAERFYKRIEIRIGARFYSERRAIRLLKSDDERSSWAQRQHQPAFQKHLVKPQPEPLLDDDVADSSGGGFAMHSAQLDVAAYLAASRDQLACRSMTVNWRQGVRFGANEIVVEGLRTRWLISCEGYAASRNPFFSFVPFKPAKGDILLVRFLGPMPPDCLHHGVWVAPTEDADVFRVGSTYEWEGLDQGPSLAARMDIEQKLQAFIRRPYAVIDHQAAVRPIIQESQALIGMHPVHQQLGYFNGLGSKGTLYAPSLAQCFTDFLVSGTPIPEALNVRKHCLS
jgi:glycine oxidase